MKKLLLISLLLFVVNSYSQRLDQYKASNGITYKEGDTVKLGRGSGQQGTFVHLQLGGWMSGTTTPIGANYANMAVDVKKIKKKKFKGVEKVFFVVGGGNITNYNLMIEEAIQTCEVVPCENEDNGNTTDKYDLLAKIKKLYDQGVLTEEEYEKEKAKVLGQ